MTIALSKDGEAFLEDQVRAGVCENPSALVNDVLRSLNEQRRLPGGATPELEDWLLQSLDSPVTPLTTADFDGIRHPLA